MSGCTVTGESIVGQSGTTRTLPVAEWPPGALVVGPVELAVADPGGVCGLRQHRTDGDVRSSGIGLHPREAADHRGPVTPEPGPGGASPSEGQHAAMVTLQWRR